MPSIYLSPSTQEYNPYITGGTEEYYMNLIADAMEPYLDASGIEYARNTPGMTAASSIAASNAGNYDFHLALHSNAASGDRSGRVRGCEVYFYPSSRNGRRGADIIANNLKAIYPLPELVRAATTTRIGEVSKTKAPSVLIEFAYHDNYEDADWIAENIGEIAENVSLSLTEYFGIPFVSPGNTRTGTVRTQGRNLLIRETPSFEGEVIGSVPNGRRIYILESYGEWYFIDYNGLEGYVYSNYVTVNS